MCELHPKFSKAFNETGFVYGSMELYDEAISWHTKCIEKTPEFAECYGNIGFNYAHKNMLE